MNANSFRAHNAHPRESHPDSSCLINERRGEWSVTDMQAQR